MRAAQKGNRRVATSPRISLNKLGEYMTASVRRRRRIILDQKYPKPHRGAARYAPAREAIVRHLEAGGVDSQRLVEAVQNLGPHPFRADWQNEHRASCRFALNSFGEFFPPEVLSFGLEDPVIIGGRHNQSLHIKISGVKVSIRPDAYLQGMVGGDSVVGLLKLHFSKLHPIDPDAGRYITTLLHLYAEVELSGRDTLASRDHCVLLDVRHGSVHTAPECFKVRRQELEAACEEIAQRWGSI